MPPIITLTESAIQHIQPFLNPLSETAGFRVAMKESGCSGYSYILDVVEKPCADDICIAQSNIRIFVAQDSVKKLQGSVVDLVEKGPGQKQLLVNNPHVVDACGCGESVVIKEEENP